MASEKLEVYESGTGDLPQGNLAWQVFGAGLENLGKDGRPIELPMPDPGDDDLLVRVDAVGLCFSDVKLIRLGSEHPRIRGRDLRRDPTIPGHEVSMTVVKVGKNRKGAFNVGDKFIIQADVYYKGEGLAFGYAIPGGMTQYIVMDKRVLDGDGGCYLLPVKKSTGYSEAALSEPWACVEMAYSIDERTALKPNGSVLLAVHDSETFHKAWREIRATLETTNPRKVCVAAADDAVRKEVGGAFGKEVVVESFPEASEDVLAGASEGAGFDDILVLGTPPADLLTRYSRSLARGGMFNLLGGDVSGVNMEVDVGRVHYHRTRFLGTPDASLAHSLGRCGRIDLKPEGKTWIVGAAGPMGQMHVQRALQKTDGPRLVVASDVDKHRLTHMRRRFEPLAAERNVQLVPLNPTEFEDEAAFYDEIENLSDGGFDDIVIMAPVASVIERSMGYAGADSLVNIFAGVNIGTTIEMDAGLLTRGVKVVGSSGSRIEDLEKTLSMAESGTLSTDYAVAAVGGIYGAHEGLAAVNDGTFAGKIVIYPQVENVDLIPLEELPEKLPDVAAKLGPGGTWSREAEQEFLEEMLP